MQETNSTSAWALEMAITPVTARACSWSSPRRAILPQALSSVLQATISFVWRPQTHNYSLSVTRTFTSNAQCVAPASGLVGWWPGDGDARRYLALANTGVIEDGVTFTPGMVGKAFTLNGGAADVVVPASTALNVSSFTMAAWVFPQDFGAPVLQIVDIPHPQAASASISGRT